MIVGATGRRRPSDDQKDGGDRAYDHPLLLSTRTSLPPSHGASLLGSELLSEPMPLQLIKKRLLPARGYKNTHRDPVSGLPPVLKETPAACEVSSLDP